MEMISGIFLLAAAICNFVLYASGKKNYSSYVQELDKKQFGLKEFFPIGF